MAEDGADRGDSYRWRLARAAAASCALHMLLFGGLSVSKLDVAAESPDSLQPDKKFEPKRPPADFQLQVPRSPSAEKPAHERPLDLPTTAPEIEPVAARERPVERTVADRQERPAETAEPIESSQPALDPERARDTAAAESASESPARAAEAMPAEVSATAEEAAAAAVEATAAPLAAPAAVAPRERAEVGRVAARWQPREVALLERLTARAPEANALAARDAASATASAPAAEAIDRQAAAEVGGAGEARAEAIAPTATATATTATPLVPGAAETARRSSRPAATSRQSSGAAGEPSQPAPTVSTGSMAAAATVARSRPQGGAAAGRAAGSSLARRPLAAVEPGGGSGGAVELPAIATVGEAAGGSGGPLAPSAVASANAGGRRPGQGSSAIGGQNRGADGARAAGETDSAATGIAARSAAAAGAAPIGEGVRGRGESTEGLESGRTGDLAPRPLGRDTASIAADAGGTGTVADVAPAATAVAASEGTGRGAATPGGIGRGERLGPAAVDRSRRATGGRSALSGSRGAGSGSSPDGDGAEEGLSVSPADLAGLGTAGRRSEAAPDELGGPRSPERIAAAALPADGRVRDVAEAFAGRSQAGGQPAGGIEDAADLTRARVMVDRGLEFLARSQQPDGRWRLKEFAGVTKADVPKLDSDTAATGLALLCFFGGGHDHFDGKHRDSVRRGLEFLISVQKPDGDLFLPADDLSNSCSWLYSHGIAAIAVCEAVGMTGDPLVKPAAEKACRFIAASSHPTLGGWRYTPRTDADLSVSGWMLVALRAGDLAGVNADPAALEGVRTLLAASSSASDPTRFAYNARKAEQRQTELSAACMTAVGTLMRLHTGAAADDPGVAAGAALLGDFVPSYGTPARKVRDAYLWYYASQVLVHTGGEPWQRWYDGLVGTLEPEQRTDGPLAGSWDAVGETPDRWGVYGGRLYVTALHLLALEVPWRHLPTYAEAAAR